MKLLFFKSETCGQCKKQAAEFKRNPLPCEIIDVEISDHPIGPKLMRAFEVFDVPTCVIVDDDFSKDDSSTWKGRQKWIDFVESSIIANYA